MPDCVNGKDYCINREGAILSAGELAMGGRFKIVSFRSLDPKASGLKVEGAARTAFYRLTQQRN